MEIIKKRRYIISLFITIAGTIILLSGTSYALLKGTTSAKKTQVIKAGSVELQLREEFTNIKDNIKNMDDKRGLNQSQMYEFSVENIGSTAAKYDLKLINESESGTSQLLNDKYIQVGLEINGDEYGPMNLAKIKNIIDSNIIYSGERVNYILRVWLDNSKKEELANQYNKKAYLTLKIDAEQREYGNNSGNNSEDPT